MRDYDPTTGRYLQADPLGLVAGASLYGYALENPLVFTDPTGECPWCVIAAAAAISAGLDLLLQLWMNNWNIYCVNWGQVGISGAIGAFTGGWGNAWRLGATVGGRSGPAAQAAFRNAFGATANDRAHHAIVSAGGNVLRARPGYQHGWWNFKLVSDYFHKGLHGYSTVTPLNLGQHWRYGTPTWLQWAEGWLYAGGLLDWGLVLAGTECVCED